MKIDQALAIAARARVRRRISSDTAIESDGTGTRSPAEWLILRDVRGRFVKGHAGGPGRPPRDCLREAFTSDLLAVWRRHGRQALRQPCEEHPAAYLRLIASLVANMKRD